MNAGELGFVVFVWWSLQRFATITASTAAGGHSWLASLVVAGKDQMTWLAAR